MDSFLGSFLLVDLSGAVILVAIAVLLLVGVITSLATLARYSTLVQDLQNNEGPEGVFQDAASTRAVRELKAMLRHHTGSLGELNLQGLIERVLQYELKGALVAERFIKACPGLLITLGLVGTFYGLTHSIGKLVKLVSGDLALEGDAAASLTKGLTDALSGMSVAFTTSLVGILAAIVMTLLSVLVNVPARRAAFTLHLENYLERLSATLAPAAVGAQPSGSVGAAVVVQGAETLGEGLRVAAERLEGSVSRFESALSQFADNTREFHEFNAHLKDNVQRMSLAFADFTQALKLEGQSRNRDGRS